MTTQVPAPGTGIDPVCGMEVDMATAQHTTQYQGTTYYFCAKGCRLDFEDERRWWWDEELDEQRSLARGGKELLAGIESEERERTGIGSLKVRYNKVFGYFIEISKSNLDRVPGNYDRRQTLTNAERFITPELKEYETKVLTADERAKDLELELFLAVRDAVAGHVDAQHSQGGRFRRIDQLRSAQHRTNPRHQDRHLEGPIGQTLAEAFAQGCLVDLTGSMECFQEPVPPFEQHLGVAERGDPRR